MQLQRCMPGLTPATRTCSLLCSRVLLWYRSTKSASTVCSTQGRATGVERPVKPYRTQSRIQPKEALAWPDLDLETLHANTPNIRVRQHVNPFRPDLQAVVLPLNWKDVYQDASRPLAVDIGCGHGRFPLSLAAKLTDHNILGLDIRQKLIDRANKWAELLHQQQRVHFHLANATVSFQSMLSSYPGPIQLVSIQYPDPHWKSRYRKRRIVQPQLVQAVADVMAPGGHVFLQSDVEEVVASMRDEFEYHGSFQVAEEYHQPEAIFFTEGMQVTASPRESLDRQTWQSTWQQHGWLTDNPLGVPTEREIHTIEAPASVYRVLLKHSCLAP